MKLNKCKGKLSEGWQGYNVLPSCEENNIYVEAFSKELHFFLYASFAEPHPNILSLTNEIYPL